MEKKKQINWLFRFNAPEAKEVLLCGDFTGWEENPVKLVKKGGEWSKSVKLDPGKHEYKLRVDGIWQVDPKIRKTGNSFGTENSVIEA